MSTDIICELCGGRDFYYDSGFYYCSECQRQTQDIQEHVFEAPEALANSKRSKRLAKKNDDGKQVERITSWECYNYIVLGLVNELIELGASENLKSTVEVLWFNYLKALGIVGRGDEPPKLPAYNSRTDAEILYGRRKPKKRRVRNRHSSLSSATDVSSLDHVSLKRERTRQKRALAKAKYTEFITSTQQSDVSLANQSLGSLKASTGTVPKDHSKFLRYHHSASKELKKKMTKNHLRDHCRDVNSLLTCHKPSARLVSKKYLTSPFVITRNKIFGIIYIALLINKESVQLGDMIRYAREGYLNFEYCNHFFPQEVLEKNLNVCTFNKGNYALVSAGLRFCTWKMATFLNVKKYMPVQNLVDLCKRYCEELNLPDSILKLALKLLSKTEPKMSLYDQSTFIPNYEGRAMSFIVFVLKFLFCLDDATEFDVSNLAEAIDKNFYENEHRTFNFCRWLKHIEYRKLVIVDFHYPTKYLNDNFTNPKTFIEFINWFNERHVEEEKLSLDMQLIRDQLELIKSSSKNMPEKFNFKNSRTPFRDYVKRLVNFELLGDQTYFTDLLSENFSKTSIQYLNDMKYYKELLLPGSQLKHKHGGKNDDMKFIHLFSRERLRFRTMTAERRDLRVTFSKHNEQAKIVNYDRAAVDKFKEDPEWIVKDFEKSNSDIHARNESKRSKYKRPKLKPRDTKDFQRIDLDDCIYYPSGRFWLNTRDMAMFNTEEVEEFLEMLPHTFKLVVKECARIIEQTEKDMFVEYNLVEAYLCYVFSFKTKLRNKDKLLDNELQRVLLRAKKIW